MQKYIEELNAGDSFLFQDEYWICGTDFKNNGYRNALSLKTGSPRWLSPETIIDPIQIYILDNNGTIIPVKETKKDEIDAS